MPPDHVSWRWRDNGGTGQMPAPINTILLQDGSWKFRHHPCDKLLYSSWHAARPNERKLPAGSYRLPFPSSAVLLQRRESF